MLKIDVFNIIIGHFIIPEIFIIFWPTCFGIAGGASRITNTGGVGCLGGSCRMIKGGAVGNWTFFSCRITISPK